MRNVCSSCGALNATGQPACGQCGGALPHKATSRPAFPHWHAGLLAAHVILCSVLGLAFIEMTLGLGPALGQFWLPSPAADVIFVLGTAGSGVLAYALTWQKHGVLAVVASGFLTWFTFAASLLLVTPQLSTGDIRLAGDLGMALNITGRFGIAGLVYASLGPVLLAMSARPQRATDPSLSVVVS
ncbi:MAG: hypothetical protein WDA16_14990 [Candidatus Thermoplasmatota archaeon]